MLPRVSLVEGDKAKFLLFSSGDFISNHLFTNGSWENDLFTVSKLFYDAVESPLVLDIGANLGAYSIPIAKDIQERNGRVIAFEPQRIIFYQLCANAFINRLDNFYSFNKAISDESGTVEIPEFNYNENINIGAFSLDKGSRIAHGIESSAKSEFDIVDLITLDELVLDRPPAIIKIDVEGFELNVLRGGVRFLEKYNYPPLLFEAWNFEFFIEQKKELLGFVGALGYMVYQLDSTNYVAQHPKYPVAYDFKSENDVTHIIRIK